MVTAVAIRQRVPLYNLLLDNIRGNSSHRNFVLYQHKSDVGRSSSLRRMLMMHSMGAVRPGVQIFFIIFAFALMIVHGLFQNIYVCKIYTVPLNRVILTTFYNVLLVLGAISYLKAVFTNPGNPSQSSRVDEHSLQTCHICMAYKPPRANHCYSCGKCILRMEHHCPWINNCVGYYNFKPYLLMCFYLALAGTYYTVTGVYLVFFHKSPTKLFPVTLYGIYLFTGLIFLSFTSTLILFIVQYAIHLLYGVTALERVRDTEWRDPLTSCDWSGRKGNHVYNVGGVANFERMFSKKILYAILPFTNYKDYGYEFKTIPIFTISEGKQEEKINDYLEKVMKKYEGTDIDYEDLLDINSITQI